MMVAIITTDVNSYVYNVFWSHFIDNELFSADYISLQLSLFD